MAWRIHEYVIKGEIDNRSRGRIVGHIWLAGVEQPLELDIAGDCQPDLAGCVLTFENPASMRLETRPPATQQFGTAGLITAARKVRVYDVPLAEAIVMLGRGETPPEHMANSVYIEWFSKLSGNVVIESTDYLLQVSDPAWRYTAAEIAAHEEENSEAAMEAEMRADGIDDPWDEFRCEQMLRESDLVGDRYRRLLEKYEDHPDQERLIAHEMGWGRLDDDSGDELNEEADESADAARHFDSEVTDEDSSTEIWEDDDDGEEEEETSLDPAREGLDWVRADDGRILHPVAKQAREVVYELLDELKKGGEGLSRSDETLGEFVGHFMTLHVKIAAALGSFARGRDHTNAALIIAWLKRALEIHNQTLTAAQALEGHAHFSSERLAYYRGRLFAIREAVLALVTQLRGK